VELLPHKKIFIAEKFVVFVTRLLVLAVAQPALARYKKIHQLPPPKRGEQLKSSHCKFNNNHPFLPQKRAGKKYLRPLYHFKNKNPFHSFISSCKKSA